MALFRLVPQPVTKELEAEISQVGCALAVRKICKPAQIATNRSNCVGRATPFKIEGPQIGIDGGG